METSLPPEQYRLLVEHAPTMVWRSGVDAHCNYFNATWLRFTGRTLEQEMGDGWISGVHPDDLRRCMDTYLSNFERRTAFEMEYRLRRHDGVYRYIFDRGVPFTDDAGQFAGFIGSCVDVHERREANRAKATFLALATHELRTPLTSMRMYMEALRRQLSQAQEELATSSPLLRLNAQLERVSSLVQDLEETGRLEAELPLVMHKEELELSMEQVLSNLLTNAVKYSPKGGPIHVTLAREGAGFALSVKDSGIGIPAADFPSLTRRYFRASNVSPENYPGLGLGLSLVKEILEAHGGGLRIQSELGQGTTLTLLLPEAPEEGRA
ncbi:PAS domain-containing protein [Archangium minus]|uniref:histidine kinase n=1 Tax=Archangium minus TaxID=83450 RepID=A0ABY9X738_9BACT|nr:PAS domain-containing protein [Archangium minus]